MIGLVFISVYDIFLLLHEGKFHQILYILCLDRPSERKGLAPSSDEPSKKFPVISHASVNFKLRGKKVDSQASPKRRSTACVSLSLCSALCFLLCRSPSPLASPPPLLFLSHLLSHSLLFSVWITQSLSFYSPLHLSLQ